MAMTVNLDALIPREDFEINEGSGVQEKRDLQISDLHADAFFYGALRKPDFQRETMEWDAARVVGLIRSFIGNDLIPGIILWQNRELSFVIDGSHRLSALIAWVHDDYGDGERSQEFFGYAIPEEQIKAAQRTRSLVEKEFGSYKDHRDAIANPDKHGPDTIARARRFGSLGIPLQWVKGDAAKAEDSFVRINQQAVNIAPQELELIKSRKKPNAIGARAIVRRGTGHKYWSSFATKEQDEIRNTATDLHRLIFSPNLQYPVKSLDLPAGGSVYSAPALRMVYDFINQCTGVPSPEDDQDGRRTIEYLRRCRRVMKLILSNDVSSIGLHPAVYFYSWTGKQQPLLFLAITKLILDFERADLLPRFIEIRAQLETFLIANRSLINQIVRKFGTKGSGATNLREFYDKLLNLFDRGLSPEEALEQIISAYSYLQPGESPYESGAASKRASTQVKSATVIRELLPIAPRCPICGGLVPPQAISIDHKQRVEDGGDSSVGNLQVTHPYCNTGYKEAQHAKQNKAGDK